ncbi:MAG TPA: hypothetical protein VK879_03605 [Candidatus Sulfomarinibacteraceae bacterium]|nr:hypothetical protein [Candidatus Sulfomarinibacteraceae bacterium]
MAFHSILFKRSADRPEREPTQAPAFFRDLNLDQVVDAITARKEEYDLKPFFYSVLHEADAIEYRHQIMHDLENPTFLQHINSFTGKLQEMREHLAQADDLYYEQQGQGWFLDAVDIYCEAVSTLAQALTDSTLQSRGFLQFRDYLTHYVASDHFTSLVAQTEALKRDLSTVQYNVYVKRNGVRVLKYEGEPDYSKEVEATFEKFKEAAAKDYRQEFRTHLQMNHVEAKILEFVARLFPEIFQRLDTFCSENAGYLDETIATFDREVQFYIAYLEHMESFRRAGLKFCYPQIAERDKEVQNKEGFDLALAHKLLQEESDVVPNDFHLEGDERIIVVSGPNQGGKTTFARMFGQLHYLASLGCPVPGREAHLFLFDRIFTHFEREEDIADLRGKLQDDLVRIHDILDQATPDSIIIINEIFTSTTSRDAAFLGKKIMARIIELDALCVCVTFIDELASMSEKTISMVSTVVPEDPALRTYKIVRMPADGLAYAITIAQKHRLTYEHIKDRINS